MEGNRLEALLESTGSLCPIASIPSLHFSPVYWTSKLVPRSVFQSGFFDWFWLRTVISTAGGLKLSLLCALGVGTVSSRAEILSFGRNMSCNTQIYGEEYAWFGDEVTGRSNSFNI
ncbi:hypothetical protein Rs2_21730 [Raphanus sativus]|nr:hypothetical protein Rs2_21730 [Raphanus sativus]